MVVVMVRAVLAVLEPGTTEAGLNVHPVSGGNPLHEKMIVPVYEPWGEAKMVNIADWPAVTVILLGFELNAKVCEATAWPEKPMICGEITALSFRVTVPMTLDTATGE